MLITAAFTVLLFALSHADDTVNLHGAKANSPGEKLLAVYTF